MTHPTPSHYYIYYPVRVGLEADLVRTVYLLQDDLAHQLGVRGRILRKADDPWTWMEIYENVIDPMVFEAALEQCLERHGFGRFLAEDGRRHVERFVACA